MFDPTPLNLPAYPAQLSRIKNKVYIFDILRRKNVLLTPEEWVRQQWIHHLHQKNYPKSLMEIEGGLLVNTLQKRTDLVVYNNAGEKVLLAEFKAPHVKITQKVFEQISNYNSTHKIPLLLVSNGVHHVYCRIDFVTHSYVFLEDLPFYESIT